MVWLTYNLQRFGMLSTHVACVPVPHVAYIPKSLSGDIEESGKF